MHLYSVLACELLCKVYTVKLIANCSGVVLLGVSCSTVVVWKVNLSRLYSCSVEGELESIVVTAVV